MNHAELMQAVGKIEDDAIRDVFISLYYQLLHETEQREQLLRVHDDNDLAHAPWLAKMAEIGTWRATITEANAAETNQEAGAAALQTKTIAAGVAAIVVITAIATFVIDIFAKVI